MNVTRIDHVVLTVRDIEVAIAWYERVLGMRAITFGDGRRALAFGDQKLNLHQAGSEFAPHAATPSPGSADLCFTTETPLEVVIAHLRSAAVDIEAGPVAKTGARGPLRSVYVRDPDANLVEIANEV